MASFQKMTPERIELTSAAALKRFGKYKDEDSAITRKCETMRNPALEAIARAWRSYDFDVDTGYDGVPNVARTYEEAVELTRGLGHTASDVKEFSVAMSAFKEQNRFNWKAGMFLSALIASGRDEQFTIITTHLPNIHHLGFRNSKNIVIVGDAGDYLGTSMSGGRIDLDGNAAQMAALRMEGGTIRIHGNAGNDLGRAMKGGFVIVEGDAGSDVGSPITGFYQESPPEVMNGGTIYIRGKAGFVFESAGKIYVEGSRLSGRYLWEHNYP